MNLQQFTYDLPESLIAQYPLTQRDKARLMIVDRKKGEIHHDVFSNISQYLPEKSSIVLNDSKVIPARLLGRRQGGGARVEIFLLKKINNNSSYEVLMRPLRRLKTGEEIIFNGGKLIARIEDKKNRIVHFNKKNISTLINKIGHMPLPPYIKRPDKAIDKKHYQTVYAKTPGSVAAPTAGLHFTPALLNRLKKNGHSIEKVTLHVNYGTFQPVEVNDITKHRMHSEEYSVTKRTIHSVLKAKENGQKIIAVGTTSCRGRSPRLKN